MPDQPFKPFGVIDIGSNSVRLVLFDGIKRAPGSFFNEKVLCGLGRDIAKTGKLSIEGRTRALEALKRFQVICQKNGLKKDDLVCFATAAVREASDGPDFIKAARALVGQDVQVLTGKQEAFYAAQGVLSGIPEMDGWVADLGGGSLELAEIRSGDISHTVSHPFGPFRLAGLKPKEAKVLLRAGFSDCKSGGGSGTLCLVGGAWRTMAKVHMASQKYPIRVLHHYAMSAADARAFADEFSKKSVSALSEVEDIPARRVETIPTAALVLRELIDALQPSEIVVSAHGVREGILFDRLEASERKKDPLIEGARGMARRRSQDPEVGEEAVDFAADFFAGYEILPYRLVAAAARLSDIAWRDHPNYRRANILHAVLHAPLDGLTHFDRITIALSLYYRYGGESSPDAKAVVKVIGAEEQKKARILGAFLRFAHNLVGQTSGIMPACSLTQNESEIILKVSQGMSGLVGEIAIVRLETLGNLLGKAVRVGVRDYS